MKRKIFTLTLVLCMALTMAVAMPAMAEEVNLVTNGDFEHNEPVLDGNNEPTGEVTYTKADGVTPLGWRSVSTDGVFVSPDNTEETKPRAMLMTETVGEGDGAVTNHYLKITNTTTKPDCFATDVRLTPGTTYKVSVKSKDMTKLDGQQGQLQINPHFTDQANNWARIARVRLYGNYWMDTDKAKAGEWIDHSIYFTVPETAVAGEDGKVQICFRFRQETNNVEYGIDDFSVVECPNGTYSATLDAGEDGVISPGEEVTVSYSYGRTFTGYSGAETYDPKTTYDADPFQILTCVYKEESGKKVLCGVTLTDADAGCVQCPNNKAMGIYDFYGENATSFAKAIAGKATVNIPVTIPESSGTYTIKTFAWDGVSGLQARTHAITLGGSAE